MFTLQIKSITKESSVETGERFLAVNFEILKDDKVELTKIVAYPLDISLDEIKKELQKYVENHTIESARKKQQAIVDKEDKNADNIISNLENKQL